MHARRDLGPVDVNMPSLKDSKEKSPLVNLWARRFHIVDDDNGLDSLSQRLYSWDATRSKGVHEQEVKRGSRESQLVIEGPNDPPGVLIQLIRPGRVLH